MARSAVALLVQVHRLDGCQLVGQPLRLAQVPSVLALSAMVMVMAVREALGQVGVKPDHGTSKIALLVVEG